MSLYLVATPIGNLEDLTFRALRILKEVDWIACEDTRHTQKLLAHYGFSKPLLSFYSQNQRGRIPQIIQKLQKGESIALVTDAGTPGISDPGTALVAAVLQEKISIIPIPGPCAAITAICASGLPTDSFYFQGFLPVKPGRRKNLLMSLKAFETTLIFYEPTRHLERTLREFQEVFGDKSIVIARELTKVFEEFISGSISDLLVHSQLKALKGECVLLINNR